MHFRILSRKLKSSIVKESSHAIGFLATGSVAGAVASLLLFLLGIYLIYLGVVSRFTIVWQEVSARTFTLIANRGRVKKLMAATKKIAPNMPLPHPFASVA